MLSSVSPVHVSRSEVNCSVADAQVVSCYRYLVVFHPFVEQLTAFHTSGLVLPSSSILRVLDLDLHRNIEGARTKEVHKLPYSGKIWRALNWRNGCILLVKFKFGDLHF